MSEGKTMGDVLWAIGTFLWNNKTKLTGAIVAVLSFVQANPSLRNLLTESAYNWTMFIIGCVVIFFGFLNSNTPPQPPTEAP